MCDWILSLHCVCCAYRATTCSKSCKVKGVCQGATKGKLSNTENFIQSFKKVRNISALYNICNCIIKMLEEEGLFGYILPLKFHCLRQWLTECDSEKAHWWMYTLIEWSDYCLHLIVLLEYIVIYMINHLHQLLRLGHEWMLIFNIWTFFYFQFQIFECLLMPTQWVFNSLINLCSDSFMDKTSNKYLTLLTYSNKVPFLYKICT